MPWTPVLEGPPAAAAHRLVHAIAVDVAARPVAAPAERTLFWAYATNLIDEPFAHAAYDAAMDDLIAALQHGVPHAALYGGGLAGIGWTCAHVLDGGAEDVLAVIDEAMVSVVDVEHWDGAHDLAQGLVGYGVYFLERLGNNCNAALARTGLDRVVAHLERSAHRSDHGTAWLTAPAAMAPELRAAYPDGFYDLGLAHGVPGIHSLLSRAARVTGDARARRLAGEALHWLVLHRGPAGYPALVAPRFARGSQPDISLGGTRAAWCYGDPGVAAALWGECPELARQLALACAARGDTDCRDAGLCHGTAGLAHLLNRFAQASGEPRLRTAARAWFERTLALPELPAAPGIIEGNMGVALALIAAITDAEPSWDRMLLADAGALS